MREQYVERVHSEHAVLDIGQDVGALIIYTREELRGREIEVSPLGEDWPRTHTRVLERRANGKPVFAALFLALAGGEYTIWRNALTPADHVTIAGGEVAEVDWRNTNDILGPDYGPALRASVSPAMLPPRYRDGLEVCITPMGAAPMHYAENGQVAWDQMWTTYCDLALAGGPPHRGILLEPVMPAEVQTDMDGYERVLAEIGRGLRLVTELPIVRSDIPGWIGLQCESEAMALWMQRAIMVENVCVRRADSVLYLPAGPAFQVDKEIKNVITVAAKTHHYWAEHRDA